MAIKSNWLIFTVSPDGTSKASFFSCSKDGSTCAESRETSEVE